MGHVALSGQDVQAGVAQRPRERRVRSFVREHRVERGALWLVWPPARPTPPKVKAFGDLLAQLPAELS